MPSLVPGLLIVLSTVASAATVPTRFETIAQQAKAARAQEHAAEAIRLYREGTQLQPSWSEGWWYLGSLLYDQDRFSEASSAFQHLLASTSHRGPAANAFLGLCNYETGKYEDALREFRAWASAGWAGPPELFEVAIFHFALLLTREGKPIESLYLLASLAPRLGDTPELTEAMGLASLRMHYLPENYPPELRERIWLAGKAALYAAKEPKDFTRAEEFAASLEERYPDQPEIHYFHGSIYTFEGKSAEAEAEYRKELKISPNHSPSLVALATIDLDKGDVADADRTARTAVLVDPGNAEAHHLLGRVLQTNRDFQASVPELETAKRLAPDSASVRFHLAMAYKRVGRKQEAEVESAAALVLKNKEDVMAPAKVKLGNAPAKERAR